MLIDTIEASPTIGTTEYSLGLQSTSGAPTALTVAALCTLVVDGNAMVAGDEVLVQVYEKAVSGGTQRVVQRITLTGTMLVDSWDLGLLKNGYDVTFKKIAGTDRALPMSLRRALQSPTAGDIADAVLDEALSGHNTAGTAGAALAAASAPSASAVAAAVCEEALAGHSTAGTVGKALSDASTAAATVASRLDATVTSRAATSDVTTVGTAVAGVQTTVNGTASTVSSNLNATVSSRASSSEVTTVGSAVAAVAAVVAALPSATAVRDAIMTYAIEVGETFEAMQKNMAAVLTGETTKVGDDITWKSKAGVARVVGRIIAGVRTITTRLGT